MAAESLFLIFIRFLKMRHVLHAYFQVNFVVLKLLCKSGSEYYSL